MIKYHGKEFTATIHGDTVSGKICIEDDKLFLCQNKRMGQTCNEMFGYSSSWVLDNAVDKLVIDGEPINLKQITYLSCCGTRYIQNCSNIDTLLSVNKGFLCIVNTTEDIEDSETFNNLKICL
jgi:hypothetical protein